MSLKSKKILGISITIDSREKILEFLKRGLKKTGKNGQKTWVIVTPNPEQVVLARKNPHFAEILNRADVAIPDGIGLVWADRILHSKSHLKRITGIGFMEDLIELATREPIPIGLIGGRGGVAVSSLECLSRRRPGLRGWATDGPEIRIDNGSLIESEGFIATLAQKIIDTKTQVVFVGLGAPKQEYFIEAISRQLSAVRRSEDGRLMTDDSLVFMSVGGAFDEISGRLPKPSKFIDRYGLKWLWRLILEPWRWKRQLALFEFIFLVFKEKLRYDKKV